MKTIHLLCALILTAGTAHAQNKVQITANRSFGKKDIGRQQSAGSVSGRLNTRAVHYTFKVRSVTPGENRFTAEWVVLIDMMGMEMPVAHGQKKLDLRIGQTATLRSDPVDKKELKLRNIPNVGDMDLEKTVQGYGIRVLDQQGQVIGEKYSSKKAQSSAGGMLAKLSKTTNSAAPMTLDQLIQEIVKKIKSLGPPKAPPKPKPGGFPPGPPFRK